MENDEVSGKRRAPEESVFAFEGGSSKEDETKDIGSSPKRSKSFFTKRIQRGECGEFIRQASQFKSLLDTALTQILQQQVVRQQQRETAKEKEESSKSKVPEVERNAALLAREKTTECLLLERKFKEAETEAATLKATNESLRESLASTNARLERTVEALRIAGNNAASARNDADAAEAYATSLANQVESLSHIVEETKRAAKSVADEHEEITDAARKIESRIISRETEFARLQQDQRTALNESSCLKRRCQDMIHQQKKKDIELEEKSEELYRMKQLIDERESMENARQSRSAIVEKELREARSLLVDASSTQSETEASIVVLKDTIKELQVENKSWHEKVTEMQAKHRGVQESFQERLGKAEKDAQNLRIKVMSFDEEKKRFKDDKAASEKQVAQLKNRLANLERRLRDATSLTENLPLGTKELSRTINATSTETTTPVRKFTIPPLTPASSNSSKGSTIACGVKESICSICSNPASGMMKSCQCGGPCSKRAHATCIAARNASYAAKGLHLVSPGNATILCERTS